MIGRDWSDLLSSHVLRKTDKLLSELRKLLDIRPQPKEIFTVFRTTKIEDIKVVIIGQDPYYSNNNANGFAFACKNTISPSLEQIFHAVQINYNLVDIPKIDKSLELWINQGVFFLNRNLTISVDNLTLIVIWVGML
jgi:uracil-DNA glycosylase